MHKHQMPWHFLSCQTIIFLSVYLQLMIEFPSPKNPISALCMYPQYTQLLRVHTTACTAKLISSLQMGAYGNSLDYFPPSPKHRCVLWDQRLSVAAAHAHSLAAGQRERERVLLLNNPPPSLITQCSAHLPPPKLPPHARQTSQSQEYYITLM